MHESPIQKSLIKTPINNMGGNESVWWRENEKAVKDQNSKAVQAKDVPSDNLNVLPASNAVAVKRSVKNPAEDKSFQDILKGISSSKQKFKKHPSASAKVKESQASVKISPSVEKGSIAGAAQVLKMSEQQKGKFNAATFKAKLMKSIENATPADEQKAKEFKKSNKLDETKKELSSAVSSEKDTAGGNIEAVAVQAPDTSKVQVTQALPVSVEQPGLKGTLPVNGLAAPKPVPIAEISMETEAGKLDMHMSGNGVTNAQLERSNEPAFIKASESKRTAQKSAKNIVTEYKSFEDPALKKEKKDSDGLVSNGLSSMYSARSGEFKNIDADKSKHKSKEEEIRLRVAEKLNGIYDKTQKTVTQILSDLDIKVNTLFDATINSANLTFTNAVEEKLDKYYSLGNIGNRIVNSLYGLPNEIEKIFAVEKKRFEATMTKAIDLIAQLVEIHLNKATAEIAKGKTETETYWNSQSTDVKKAAGDVYTNINDKYSELEKKVSEKEDSLVQGLTQKYTAAVSSLTETFNKLKEEKKGWIQGAFDAIDGAIKAIKEMQEMMSKILAKVSHIIPAIIADPIGFLGKLIDAVSLGIKNFNNNFLKHLKAGFFQWLMGAMPKGIEFPVEWDMKGIFTFVMSVLGLTWNSIRARVVDKIGEPAVKGLEKVFEVFQVIQKDGIAGLWNYIKEKINDLKASIIDSVMEMLNTKIIKAGLSLILSMMNPASAFIKACKMIYDLVMWFVNNAKRIIELINSIVDSTALIVEGNLQKASEKVEESMARIIPVTIGFLAALLNLGDLSEKVQEIINKIRAPINKAIDWIIDKALAIAKATGIPQLIAKGKDYVEKKVEQGKEWAKDKAEKGKEWVKDKAGKLLSFLGLKKTFKTEDGETHSIFFEGDEENARLMIASKKEKYESFLEAKKLINKDVHSKALNKFNSILDLLREIKKLILNKDKKLVEKEVTDHNALSAKNEAVNLNLSELSVYTQVLYGISETEAVNKKLVIEFEATKNGFGEKMSAKNIHKNNLMVGSAPGIINDEYKSLKKRKKGGGDYYKLGHLLNQQLGGSGEDFRNLTPLTASANSMHHSKVEKKLKETVKSGVIVDYSVKANFGNSYVTPIHKDDDILDIAKKKKEEINIIKSINKVEQTIPNSISTIVTLHDVKNYDKTEIITETIQNIDKDGYDKTNNYKID